MIFENADQYEDVRWTDHYEDGEPIPATVLEEFVQDLGHDTDRILSITIHSGRVEVMIALPGHGWHGDRIIHLHPIGNKEM